MLLLSIHHDARNNPRAQPLVSLTLDGCETHSISTTRTKAISPCSEIRPAFSSHNDSFPRPRRTSSESAVDDHGATSPRSNKSSTTLPQHLIGSQRKCSSIPTSRNPSHSHHHRHATASLTKISDQALAKPMLRQRGSSQQPHVTFSKIHIREHSITVGDHDWCEGSLPIQLDWQHTPTHSMDLDDYEWHRERQGRTPRGRLPKLDPSQRKKLLRRVAGITEEDLFLLERQHIDSKYVTQHCSKTVTFYVS